MDENFGRRTKEHFEERGYEVSTVLAQKMCSSSDSQIFEHCRKEGYCLVTLDKDFSNVLNFTPDTCPGIVVIRLPRKPKLSDIQVLIRTFLNALEKESVDGKLWIVETGRIREYQQETS
ncbi:MAG: DUF5615 family PIN-like protein [bacterium]